MTNQPFNNHPESSPPNQLRRDDPRGGYNPITLDDLEPPIESAPSPLDTNRARLLAALLFVLIFVVSRRFLSASPIIIVVLLAGLLYRMTKREQLIAGAPLTFAAVRLASLLTERFEWWNTSLYSTQGLVRASDLGLPWMPLFFAVCLFYMPVKHTYTSKVIFWDSVLLLLSGLLPGEGFTVAFAFVLNTLFIAIAVALACDLLPAARLLRTGTTPAVQPQQA